MCPATSCRLLRLRLAYWWLVDHCRAMVPASPLFAKNSSLNCFLNAKTLAGQEVLIQTINPNKKTSYTLRYNSFFGRGDRIQPLRVLPVCPPKGSAFRYRTAHLFAKKQSAGLFLFTQKPPWGSNPPERIKKRATPCGISRFLVGVTGFGPATSWPPVRRISY